MALSPQKKQEIIKDLIKKFQHHKAILLVDFSGCDSEFLSKLREELKKLNGYFQVVKKTLLKKSLERLKKKEILKRIEEIEGPLALAFGFGDEIVPAKICYQFSQQNENLKILGGIIGDEFVDREKVIELAKLPSKQELLGRFVGVLQNPISGLVNVLESNIKGLIFALSAIKENKQ